MQNNSHHKEHLISEQELIQYFKGTLPSEQQDKIRYWIAASEENKMLAEQIYKITLGNDIIQTVKDIPVEDALKKVNQKIAIHQINSFGKWAKNTAAILFVPLLFYTLFLLTNQENTNTEAISFRTNPGIVADFSLPDGTKVWLNAHSSLTYPSRFIGKERRVQLNGEAYFKVKSDKEHPFIVDLNNKVEVEATGTEFNIDAYEQSQFIATTLVTGGVNVRYPNNAQSIRTKAIKPGQKLVFDRDSRTIKQTAASTLVETGWKDGMIYLDNTPLEHLLHTLHKRFDVDFVLKDGKLKENRFTGTFGSQDLEMVLKHLEISSGIKHKINIPVSNEINKRIVITLY